MKIMPRPVRTTILLGLICGLGFIPVKLLFDCLLPSSAAFQMTIWLCLALYGWFLARWGKQRCFSLLFPLLIPLIFIFTGNSENAFLILSMGILSWIRSGICFRKQAHRKLAIELLVCGGGGALVACFSPHSAVSWAIGIWMFFLVQSLYFLFLRDFVSSIEDEFEIDPFERARLQAERILEDR